MPSANINWLADPQLTDQPLRPVLRVNNIYAMYRAVVSGLGIAALPAYMARLSSELVNVLSHIEGPHTDVYFIYPEEMRQCLPRFPGAQGRRAPDRLLGR